MKSERFEMRLDEMTINRIDLWKASQRDTPSRAEAVRRLLDVGLSVAQPNEIYLSNSEKLMTYMLCEMMKKMGNSDEIDPDFVESAIVGGHYWALGWEMQGIFHNDIDAPSAVREVVDILDMWSFIEEAFADLTVEEQAEIKDGTEYSEPSFLGFDGNNETEHMGIARFMINHLERFTRFKDHKMGLNSHIPVLGRYRAMVREFEPIRAKLVGRRMGLDELKVLLSRDA
jgi:uncharacterized protein YfbU (UPF0304 family)